MDTKTKLLVAAAVLAGGCATQVAAPLVIAPARAGTNPTRWEYTCVEAGTNGAHPDMPTFDRLGAQGWELAASASAGAGYAPSWCFKRALP